MTNVPGDLQDSQGNPDQLTARQRREREYHKEHAGDHAAVADQAIPLGVTGDKRRRWWNAYWSAYTILLGQQIAGKRALVPGCGFGDDAVRLASMGAKVHTFDLSPDVLEIARRRAAKHPGLDIQFDVMTAESLSYPDDFFDLVVLVDILHHVDIPKAMAEIRRVLKPDGVIVGDELYTHSSLQRIRESALITRYLYGRMQRFIYKSDKPYITEDEHKIDEKEFAIVRNGLADRGSVQYFNLLAGRLFPTGHRLLDQLDRVLIAATMSLGRYLAGRVVFVGQIAPKDTSRHSSGPLT